MNLKLLDGHPITLLDDRTLRNFEIFLRNNPRGLRSQGAMDAKPVPGSARRGIPLYEFRRGGAFDAAPTEGNGMGPTALLRWAAERLDAKSWSQFRLALLGQDPDADETDAEDDTEEHDRNLAAEQMRQARKRAAELAATPKAMDAARLAFDAQYPRAGRVKRVPTYGSQAESSRPVTAAGAASFAATFPKAKPVRRV